VQVAMVCLMIPVYIKNLGPQMYQAGVYFNEVETSSGPTKFIPRSVQVDLEDGVSRRVRTAAVM
jgi:tubulin beta